MFFRVESKRTGDSTFEPSRYHESNDDVVEMMMIKVVMMLTVIKYLSLTVPVTPLATIVVPLVLEHGEHQRGQVGDHLEDDNEDDHDDGGEQNVDDDYIGGEARNHLEKDDRDDHA